MNDLKIYKDKNELLNALAEFICEVAQEAINARGQFNFVLSGGGSPKSLYELLASEKFRNKIDWSKTYFFFGDERFVPAEDSQRNSLMAQQNLFEPLLIKDSHIFKVNTLNSPEVSAKIYSESIEKHFGSETARFDFILLGLGSNAHTASLFPYTAVLSETESTIKAQYVDEVKMYRITMTAPLINQARTVAFLVFGKDKCNAVYEVLQGSDGSANKYPARLIRKSENKVIWFLDTEAACRLENYK